MTLKSNRVEFHEGIGKIWQEADGLWHWQTVYGQGGEPKTQRSQARNQMTMTWHKQSMERAGLGSLMRWDKPKQIEDRSIWAAQREMITKAWR